MSTVDSDLRTPGEGDPLVLGIDASNLRGGGGVNHLRELLAAADPIRFGFRKVIVWAGTATVAVLPERSWLEAIRIPALDRSLPVRLIWQTFRLPAEVRNCCDILFAPGGSVHRRAIPYVTMSRNLLPFEPAERRRYGLSLARIRLWLLRHAQVRTFARAGGVIFLSDYARGVVERAIPTKVNSRMIPHGVAADFGEAAERVESNIFRLLYVSPIKLYKHQWNVVMAVSRLREEGISIELHLVGPNERRAYRKLQATRRRFDPDGHFVRYHGELPHAEVADQYRRADALIFASTCENLPNILLEAIAAGLPIASSDRGPMTEVLGDDALYLDPESVDSIAATIRTLVLNVPLRRRLTERAARRSESLPTWAECATETLQFLADVARDAGSRS